MCEEMNNPTAGYAFDEPEIPALSGTAQPLVMTEDQRKEFLRNVFYRQNKLAANSNFQIKGFDQHRFGSLLQAFAEELGLIKIES